MVVGTAGDDLVALRDEGLGHRPGIGEDLLLVGHEFRLHGLVERNCLCRNDMLERTALYAREHA